jgi:hypothetical protein
MAHPAYSEPKKRAASFLLPVSHAAQITRISFLSRWDGRAYFLALLMSTVIGMSLAEHAFVPTVQDIESRMPFPGLV